MIDRRHTRYACGSITGMGPQRHLERKQTPYGELDDQGRPGTRIGRSGTLGTVAVSKFVMGGGSGLADFATGREAFTRCCTHQTALWQSGTVANGWRERRVSMGRGQASATHQAYAALVGRIVGKQCEGQVPRNCAREDSHGDTGMAAQGPVAAMRTRRNEMRRQCVGRRRLRHNLEAVPTSVPTHHDEQQRMRRSHHQGNLQRRSRIRDASSMQGPVEPHTAWFERRQGAPPLGTSR